MFFFFLLRRIVVACLAGTIRSWVFVLRIKVAMIERVWVGDANLFLFLPLLPLMKVNKKTGKWHRQKMANHQEKFKSNSLVVIMKVVFCGFYRFLKLLRF